MTCATSSIYFDNNATTELAPEVREAMIACLVDGWGNPSSKHRIGMRTKERMTRARAAVAALIGATAPEVVFTASATEANHAAILGGLAARPGRRHVVASAVEHPATLMLLAHLETRGFRVTRLGVSAEGELDLDELTDAVGDDTAVVTLMWANNETGVVFPVAEATEVASSRGALFHTDAVQAAGRLPIDLSCIEADLLTLSGHKLHGPKGAGVLFVRKGLELTPMIFGNQERGRRGGTENVPAIVALGVAAELAAASLPASAPRMAGLRDRLERGLLAQIPGLRINGGTAARLCNTSSIRIAGLDAEPLLERLDRAGICASSGAACVAGGTEPSHVLLAMGLSRDAALGSIRFSLSRLNDAGEIDRAVERTVALAASLISTMESAP